jgi:general secretion pathway protein D
MKGYSRCFAALAISVASCNVHSQTKSSWAFYDVKLSEIVRVGLSQLLNKSFVADDALIRDERRVSLDLKADQSGKAGPLLVDLLLDYGYTVTEKDGLWKIRKATNKDKENDIETFIYRPKFRSASYFYDVLGIGKSSGGSGSSSGVVSTTGVGSTNKGRNASATQSNEDIENTESATRFIDRRSDVVYLRGTPHEISKFRQVVDALDVPEGQVEITASVYEYSASEGSATAIGAVINFFKGKITGQVGAVTSVGDFLKLDTSALQAIFSMIAEDKRFNLISSPNVRVKSGAPSRISVGASVPTLAATTQSTGQVTQSIAYQPTGIILEVQPEIFQDVIDLKIRQSVSEAVATSTGVNNSPTLTNRELQTSVSMVDGESIALGGLTSSKHTNGSSGLPFLPQWSRSKSKNEERTELLIFLKVVKSKLLNQAATVALAPSP